MSSELTLNKKDLDKILNTLRSPKDGKLFTDVVKESWGKLGLDGNPNSILIENLLIEVIEKLYGDQNTNPAVNSREQAKRYDISLLTFGLLDGYYHTKIDQGIEQTTSSLVRYNQYLDANVFVDLDYPDEGTYREIVIKEKIARPGKQPRPLNKLTSISGKCRAEVCSALLTLIRSGKYKNCSQEAVFDEKTGQRTDLPKPHFILENFLPKGYKTTILPGSEPKNISKASSTTKRHQELCMANIPTILLGILVMIALFFCVQYTMIQKRNSAEFKRSIAAQERNTAAIEKLGEDIAGLISAQNADPSDVKPNFNGSILISPDGITEEKNIGAVSD